MEEKIRADNEGNVCARKILSFMMRDHAGICCENEERERIRERNALSKIYFNVKSFYI